LDHQILLTLVNNAALLLLIVYLYDLASSRWRFHRLAVAGFSVGIALGLVGVAIMLNPLSMPGGVFFDTRSVLLGIAGLFFGPVPAAVAMAMTGAYRIYLGGSGLWVGLAVILFSGCFGLLWRRRRHGADRRIGVRELYLFGLTLHIVMLLMMMALPADRATAVLSAIAIPVMAVYPVATAMLGTLIGSRIEYERQADALTKSEAHLQALYQYAPVALWKEDWSSVQTAMAEIRAAGHDDLGVYLAEHPGEAWRLAGLVRVLDVNEAGLAQVGAASVDELKGPIDRFFDDDAIAAFAQQLARMSEGQNFYQGEGCFVRLDGEKRNSVVSLFVLPGHEEMRDLVMVSVVDMTEHKRYEADIRESYMLLHNLSDHVPGMLFQYVQAPSGSGGHYAFMSKGVADVYGVTVEQAKVDPDVIFRCFHPDDRDRVLATIIEASRSLTLWSQEYRVLKPDGSEGRVSGIARPYRMPDGGTLWHGYVRNVTALKQAEARLRLASRVFDTTGNSIMVTDADMNIVAVNPEFTRVTGYAEAEVLGRNPRILNSGRHDAAFFQNMWQTLREEGHWSGEIWNRRKSGEVYPEWLSLSVVGDEEGRVQNYVGAFSDLTEIHRAQLLAERMAYEDAMTGLNNRLAFLQLLEKRVEELNQGRRYGGMLLVDIDDFKRLNETRGLRFGDALLKDVASRLRQMLGLEHYLARVGPDEFGILLVQQSASRDEMGRQLLDLAERMRGRFDEPFRVGDESIVLGFSMGIVVLPENPHDRSENILQQAEWAINQSHGKGDTSICFFQAEMGQQVRERYRLEQELGAAVAGNQLRLYLPPLVDAAGRQVSAEALIRWEHPERGLVPPGMFIPLAEASDRIYELERWMLREVCGLLVQLDARGRSLKISLNVSAKHFAHDEFVEEVRSQVALSGADPGCLVFEITEGIVIDDMAAVTAKMQTLAEMGIHFSLDDFGTGYSSLSYLKRLPVQELKIDRSFIMDVPDDANDAALVETILGVARTLKLRVVAEGVETQAQAEFLNERGDVIHQGYLYDRPMPVAQWLEKYIDATA
jgi:diguanylate cyclase (GGDEF)-like protein/PAS domain S-box-containing protein